jgi:hypothetical protein
MGCTTTERIVNDVGATPCGCPGSVRHHSNEGQARGPAPTVPVRILVLLIFACVHYWNTKDMVSITTKPNVTISAAVLFLFICRASC